MNNDVDVVIQKSGGWGCSFQERKVVCIALEIFESILYSYRNLHVSLINLDMIVNTLMSSASGSFPLVIIVAGSF